MNIQDSKEIENSRQTPSISTAKSNRNIIPQSNNEVVYIIKWKAFDVNADWYYKIGKTIKGRETDRLMEIIRGFFIKHRYTPYTKLLRFQSCSNAFEVETKLHRLFKDKKVYFEEKKSFGGSNEFFLLNEHELLKEYDKLLPKKEKAAK